MQTKISSLAGELDGECRGPRRSRGPGWFTPAFLRLGCLLLLVTLAVPGCSGCGQDPDEANKEEEEEEEEKPKEDFESSRVVFMPAEQKESGSLKPGHWGVFSQQMRANNFDFVGQLYVAPANRSQQEMEIEGTPYRLALRRPVSLPKGQIRDPNVMFFMPRPREHDATSAYLRVELRTQGGGRMVSQSTSAASAVMPDHQYFMVVLSGRPNDYGYLSSIFSRSPVGGVIGRNMNLYRVVRPQITTEVPLPDHPLAWTGIAYLVMDDFDPSVMTPAQEAALIDWLHWGGQIIISGPRTLDRLKSTALAEYLPAEAGSAVELSETDFSEINEFWHLDPRADSSTRSGRLRQPERTPFGEALAQVEEDRLETDPAQDVEPVEGEEVEGESVADTRRDSTETLLIADGVELKLQGNARWMPNTGELVAERQVGRGRIVATSFALSNRAIGSYWVSRESFINGALMGLPARRFSQDGNLDSTFRWVGKDSSFPLDPRVVSNMRFFSRDLGSQGGSVVMRPKGGGYEQEVRENIDRGYYYGYEPEPTEPETWEQFAESETLVHGGWGTAPHSGVAGWYDFSATANAARDTLNEAAGIEVPSGDFVAQVLLGYIFVLVPVNWLFFRLIGRVELAWVAAPLIAIVGMVVVVRVAQLDIGFARSRTEVAVLELQPGHDRGHLTRYVGLYTSLASGFSLGAEKADQPGDEPLLLPFSIDPQQGQLQQTRSTVHLDRADTTQLNGMNVLSASTGMVHIEQMLPLGGSLQLVMGEGSEPDALSNGTTLTLHDVAVVRRSGNGERVEGAWVGELEPGASVQLEFNRIGDVERLFAQWNESTTTKPSVGDGSITLSKLIDLASDPGRLQAGDARLVGWCDAELAPINVKPRTTQNVFRTMVVANLAYGEQRDPAKDENLPPVLSEDTWGGDDVMEVMPFQPE